MQFDACCDLSDNVPIEGFKRASTPMLIDDEDCLCKSCGVATAVVYCKADAVGLCSQCDDSIHSLNKIVARHVRVPISAPKIYSSSPSFIECCPMDDTPIIGLDDSFDLDQVVPPTTRFIPTFDTDLDSDFNVPSTNRVSDSFLRNLQLLQSSQGKDDVDSEPPSPQLPTENLTTTATADASAEKSAVEEPVDEADVDFLTGRPRSSRGPGEYSPAERMEALERYRRKRDNRGHVKRIKYECRKVLADNRPRIKGRFAKPAEILAMQRAAGLVPRRGRKPKALTALLASIPCK